MKSNSRNKNNHEEQLRFENELEKLKLSATHGAKFFTGENVPPEVENEWLKNIIEFEDQFEIHNIDTNEKEEEASVEFFVDYKGAKESKCVSHKGESYAKLRKSPEGH